MPVMLLLQLAVSPLQGIVNDYHRSSRIEMDEVSMRDDLAERVLTMAQQGNMPGLWALRNITWITVGAACVFGLVMMALDMNLLLAFFPAAATVAAVWFVARWRLRSHAAIRTTAILPAEAAFAAPKAAMVGLHIIGSFPIPLIITEANEVVSNASRTAIAMFPGLVPGRPVSLAIRDPDFLEAVTRTGRDGIGRMVTLTELAPVNRAMRVHVNAVMEAGPDRPVVVCVFEDLTEQHATERMRVDFIANASHELRTPLASLLGFIETLQGPARDDPAARTRFLGIMREQAGRMARLIDDLLSLSRAELRAHQQPTALIDLRSIVREIMDSLSLSAKERGVALRPDLPGNAALIRGDRDDLLRLVENLVENGIRYGREGLSVDISVRLVADDEIALIVKDHGPGIAAEHIPRLTERFYRADISHSRENGGTGLGLAIVKHLVARHKGRLEIESPPGEGATFRVTFPAALAPVPAA